MPDKQRLTLYVERGLTKEMKILALQEDKSLSVLTEQLWREYLERRKGKPKP
jgi:hypothetical protein